MICCNTLVGRFEDEEDAARAYNAAAQRQGITKLNVIPGDTPGDIPGDIPGDSPGDIPGDFAPLLPTAPLPEDTAPPRSQYTAWP